MSDNNTEQYIYEEGTCQALKTSDTEPPKIQYILNENGEITEIPKDKCIPVEHPIKCRLANAFEVFVRVNNTEHYFISNYGRLVNNRRNKNHFYEHKTGYCHYSIYEVEKILVSFSCTMRKNGTLNIDRKNKRIERRLSSGISAEECEKILVECQEADKTRVYEIERKQWERSTYTDELVAELFLVPNGRCRIWHKDGDVNNNWYKNLIYVTDKQFWKLNTGRTTWQELGIEQEYVEYENHASTLAYQHYNAIKTRCKETKNIDRIGAHYADAVMCQEWRDNPKSFIKWYFEHYYLCEDESMAIDKDLFGNGSRIYSPETCCILPQCLNTLLANCKKHYYKETTTEKLLPMGIQYSGRANKYYGVIQLSGIDTPDTADRVRLSYWNTAEEAFEEYKKVKQAVILMTIIKYKDRIPDYIYKKFLDVEIKPY